MGNEVTKVLDALCDKFGIAIDWSSNNVLPYIQQLTGKIVNYEIATSMFFIAIGVMLIMVGCYSTYLRRLFYKKYNPKDNKTYEYEDRALWSTFFMIVGFGLGLVVILTQVYDIITCYTLPEKAVVEMITDMISDVSY